MRISKGCPPWRPLLLLALLASVPACGAPSAHHGPLYAAAGPIAHKYKGTNLGEKALAAAKAAEKTSAQPASAGKRLVIYNASLTLGVFDREKVLAQARALAEKAGGWMQALTTERITLRVPAAQLGALIETVSKLGEVLDRDIRGTDVTRQVLDLRIRLQNALKIRLRLTQLLAQAKTVKDSVLIEKELGRLTEKIERLKGQLKYFEHNVAFSTLEVGVRLKTPSGPRKRKLPFRWLSRVGMDELFDRR